MAEDRRIQPALAELVSPGLRRLQLRIPAAQLERLDQLCERSGLQRSEQVGVLIDAATEQKESEGQ